MAEKFQRPVDLARRHGLSTQAVRNYEDAGILPPAARTVSGYRAYTPRHAGALDAFLALLPGHGHRAATAIMRAVHRDATEEALRLLDESHVQLLEDRLLLEAVEAALRGVASVTTASERGDTFIGPLARRLGVKPATLRKWERAGLLTPRRDPRTGYRVYGAAEVRDARLAHQLRRGGYPLARIAVVIAQVRTAKGIGPLESTLDDWRDRLTTRGRAMLGGAAALHTYLASFDAADPPAPTRHRHGRGAAGSG
ncbi:MerR family transcriptional regulator [Virgisporangium aliadipatigenens]|uniref:MerR family transcriptional regulator n=1 Tax=Virgisporangium aliadipatigenens TaxID=741659 RepID=A0A8J4DQJ9_9ACTN|nr:TioE family transcriptional regulator [Virgisporangium aliadipatigenens]GIJ45447.1 MerR family transcriptional regulator [Virgisporangium aliadipatigenens]